MKQLCDDFGALIDTMEWREIGGWEYMRSAVRKVPRRRRAAGDILRAYLIAVPDRRPGK
jgi:hypothetical protein